MTTRIRGLDFTASAMGGKHNHLVEAVLSDRVLRVESIETLRTLAELSSALRAPGEWVLGIDFPFGLPLAFVEGMGWERKWDVYAGQALSMPVASFRSVIESFRAARPEGQKQPRRRTDVLAASQSPLTTVRTPVAYMFHAGVGYLLDAHVDVLPFRKGFATAVVVEAYPALIARRLIGGNRYKDAKPNEAAGAREARRTMVRRLLRADLHAEFGFSVQMPSRLEEACLNDGHGDVLDSVLCTLQAAWAAMNSDRSWGIPSGFDAEGWICDPALVQSDLCLQFQAVEAPPLLSAPKGAFNSSLTRVQPVFRSLLRGDTCGRSWVPNILRLAERNQDTAQRLAKAFGGLSPDTVAMREVVGKGGGTSLLERCFERDFPPPAELLRWCLDNPDRLTKPRAGTSVAKSLRGLRADLLSGDRPRVLHAQNAGRVDLQHQGSDGSGRQWWAFEGFTSVDCALETDGFILLIEGKRFEPVSSTVSWIDGRNQLSRNLGVASAYSEEQGKDFAVLLIGPEGATSPSDYELRVGWPHLSTEAQDNLLNHFLGATSWRAVCQACGLDYDVLPLTAADLAE